LPIDSIQQIDIVKML